MFETKYLPGIGEALDVVAGMTEDELIEHMSHLYGTDRLKFRATLEEIRAEAVRQTRLDFLNAAHPNYRENMKRLQS